MGCVLIVAFVFFFPAAIASAVIWPNQTANQFVGRALLIGGGFAVLVVAVGVSLVFRGRR